MTEPSTLPAWVVPGGDVFELHCTTRGYRTVKRIASKVVHVTGRAVVLTNGARYRIAELSATPPPATFYRDDPRSAARYYLLVGPEDPRGMEKL